MMRISLVIASHNEGRNLIRTVESCLEATTGLDSEVVVADDASTDGSLAELCCHPPVRVVRHEERLGVSPTKDLGGRAARGETLIFLDGHCKPEPGAIAQWVADVEATAGRAVVTPAVAPLDTEAWQIKPNLVGNGYRLGLEKFDYGWIGLDQLRRCDEFPWMFESPALIGCALATSKATYERLGGFDPGMRFWGVEDLDFGLKAWLMGHPILHNPAVLIAHRFQAEFTSYEVPAEHILVNQMRMARKTFSEMNWEEWLKRIRDRFPDWMRDRASVLFEEHHESIEKERDYLMTHRTHDEYWYADRFGLDWPPLFSTLPVATAATHAVA